MSQSYLVKDGGKLSNDSVADVGIGISLPLLHEYNSDLGCVTLKLVYVVLIGTFFMVIG